MKESDCTQGTLCYIFKNSCQNLTSYLCFSFRNRVKFNFTELFDYKSDLDKVQNDPFSIVFDIEISTVDGSILSYGIAIFNDPDTSYEDVLFTKRAPTRWEVLNDRLGVTKKLTTYPFPDYIYFDEDLTNTLKKRVERVLKNERNAFRELMSFDLAACTKLYKRHFAKVNLNHFVSFN